ncbi:MAG TPA: hypothetical protein VGI64_17260 [Streptosporangiaceae bacterium]|jgi:predicted DNA binding CopG/RHH family protein
MNGNDTNITIRLPQRKLAELRAIAEHQGLPPSTLAKKWVVRKIDDTDGAEKIVRAP